MEEQERPALAERGVAWARTFVGSHMIERIEGFEKKEKTGLEWLNKAAAQNHPRALYHLSNLHRTGVASVVGKSQEKADELLLKSANLGFATANSDLARCYYTGSNGFEEDLAEAYFRTSVAHAINDSDGKAAMGLGLLQ